MESYDVYKVWVEIERCNEESNDYETLDCPFAFTAVFKTYEEAAEFANNLHEIGESLALEKGI